MIEDDFIYAKLLSLKYFIYLLITTNIYTDKDNCMGINKKMLVGMLKENKVDNSNRSNEDMYMSLLSSLILHLMKQLCFVLTLIKQVQVIFLPFFVVCEIFPVLHFYPNVIFLLLYLQLYVILVMKAILAFFLFIILLI